MYALLQAVSSFWTARTAAASVSTSPTCTTTSAGRLGSSPPCGWGLFVPEVSVDDHPEDWQLLVQQSLKEENRLCAPFGLARVACPQ